MPERVSNRFESAPEHIPTPEEVYGVIRQLTNKETTEARKVEDEKGLFILDVTVPGEKEGELIEYGYKRTRTDNKGRTIPSEIHISHYSGEDWMGGTSAARYEEGTWKLL